MDTDSDNDIFLTQSKMSQVKSYSDSVDTDEVVNNILDMENQKPNFSLKMDIFSDISDTESNSVDKSGACKVADKDVKQRFTKPLTEVDLEALVKRNIPKNTENKTKWAINVYNAWKSNRKSCSASTFMEDLMSMDNTQLNTTLGFFIAEVRNQNGQEYHPNTLYELLIAIQHFIRENGKFVSFLDDSEFQSLRQILDAKMKELSKKGIGMERKQAEIITVEQENIMWGKGVLGTETAVQLLDTLVYNLGINFALRAGQEHRNLRVGENSQLKIGKSDTDGRRYLQYTEDISKCNPGGINHRKVSPKIVRAYENTENPNRCIVKMYEKYMALRPASGKATAFYLRLKKYPTTNEWYDDMPIGVHPLQQTIGKLCAKAGFKGLYSNHSLKATAATRLYGAGIDEQLISEKTGHRSNAVRGYKRTFEDQLKLIDEIVQNKKVKSEITSSSDGVMQEKSPKNPKEINIQAHGLSVNVKFS